MSRKVKRYTLVIQSGIETRKYTSNDYYEEIKEKIKKYNSDSKNPYLIGDLKVIKGYIYFTKYKKITLSSTLNEIDNCTLNFINENELKRMYNLSLSNPRHLLISYRANNEVRFLKIRYSKNKKYFDVNNLRNEYIKLSKDLKFINFILSNKQIESSCINNYEKFDMLYCYRQQLKKDKDNIPSISILLDFFNSFIYEKSSVNYFRKRLLIDTLIEYISLTEKEQNKQDNYDEITSNQMIIKDYAMSYLKDQYEEMKMQIMDGNLREYYNNVLIKKRI